ncbi:MAG TPA: hypothetical protein PL163_00405 [Leptospiraceae bacterium]|nr:hypothetical protein [Leptospiraceae bacterium]
MEAVIVYVTAPLTADGFPVIEQLFGSRLNPAGREGLAVQFVTTPVIAGLTVTGVPIVYTVVTPGE